MRFPLTTISLACATLLTACGGGGGGGGTGAKAQSITFAFPEAASLLMPPQTLVATASSGLPVTFASGTPSICTVDGDKLVPVKSGECSVTASQAGDSTYMASKSQQLFIVLKHPQFVLFPSPGFQSITQTPDPLVATSETGLPVAFSSTTPAVCTVSGATLTLVSKGSCSITATQAGNDNYAEGTAKTTFIVGDDKPPVLTFTTGIKSIDSTIEGGVINRWSGGNFDGWNCQDANWCSASFNAADSSLTYQYVLQTKDPKHPSNGGDPGGYLGFDLWSTVNVSKTGDTTEGLRLANQTTIKITLGQNDEWVATKNNAVAVNLRLGHFANGCNVAPVAWLKPTSGALNTYEIQLTDFKAFDKDCGLKTLNVADELAKYPIVGVYLWSSSLNVSVPGPAPTTPGYPTAIIVKGPITFQ